MDRALNAIERIDNKLPDPAALFLLLLLLMWIVSRNGADAIQRDRSAQRPANPDQELAGWFVDCLVPGENGHDLYRISSVSVVLVALLGVGVVEHTGFN